MASVSVNAIRLSSAEFEHVVSAEESAEPLPLTAEQMNKLKALLLLCVALFLFGVAVTSSLGRSGNVLEAGAGVRLVMTPPGANGR